MAIIVFPGQPGYAEAVRESWARTVKEMRKKFLAKQKKLRTLH